MKPSPTVNDSGSDRPLRPVARPQREVADHTRRRLLDEGRIAFARDGLDGTAVKPILAAVDVAPTVLYHHFGSKKGFFIAVAEEVYEQFVAEFCSAIAGLTDFDEAMTALLSAASELHRRDPTLAGVAVVAQMEARRDAEIRRELAGSLDSFVSMVDSVAALASTVSARERRAKTLALVAILNGLSGLAVSIPDTEEFAAVAQALGETITHRG